MPYLSCMGVHWVGYLESAPIGMVVRVPVSPVLAPFVDAAGALGASPLPPGPMPHVFRCCDDDEGDVL